MKVEPIEFEVNGLTLRGNFYQATDPNDLAMLFLHGWTGMPNENAATKLAENGFSCMTFSLSGHNDSEGKIEDQTRQKSMQEVLVAYDFLKSKLPANTKITVTGNSYGGYLAPLLTAERPVAALQMRVPANYPDEGFDQGHKGHEDDWVSKWRQKSIGISDNLALKAVSDFQGPIQIIEAEEDDLVPRQAVQNYVDAVRDKKQLDYHLMKGWPHSLGLDPERNRQYQEIFLNWLKTQV